MENQTRSLRSLILAGVVLISCDIGAAQDGTTDASAWISEIDTGKPGNFPALEPCKLVFKIGWNNVFTAGKTKVVIGTDRKHPGKIVGTSKGGSTNLARALWRYDHSFVSIVDPKTTRPVYFESKEIDKKETQITTNRYSKDGVTSRVRTVSVAGEREDKTKRFPHPHAFDLFSAILYPRRLRLEKDDKIAILVHPFSSTYLVRFRVLGREPHKTPLGSLDSIKLDVEISKVQKDGTLKHYKKFKRATIWVSDDEYRLPLEIRAEIFVGSIRVTLLERESLAGGRSTAEKSAAAPRKRIKSKSRSWTPHRGR